MDKGRKVCPLDTDDVSVLCCEDKCAWWDSLSGRCCIAAGADAIRDVADKLDVMCSIFEERYHAYRKSYLRPEQYMSRFLEKLEGRELTSAGHLSAQDISFSEEITEIDGLLDFYMDTYFDVDAVFGTHVCTGENDDTLNVYANYDMASGQVCDELEVDLHRADGREEPVEYRLNAVEKATLLRKMDAYCQGQTGQTLKDYSAQWMAEEMAPPTQPTM